ncbi:hypothetical protein PPERSA_06911 [Pseudocohnilembus persalinus]|uniref:Sulfite exporter TauE/SafE n=1 Tax=Pseudocohnilembus persalinus TaxID=266149 RepID=A0A0V0QZ21_PSEPJ|nr:hypothetical protein PPERSA_06911 [Pseudocohnilembus persalinus]|eukprot:KRX07296.1 hypothetical protein PPERSA_06911 [Pseudocohnilembus persalinus]
MSSCLQDSDCGRLNYCDLDKEICTHDDIFPIKGLDIFGYLLIGVFLGLQNIGGLGAGTIKIFVFMIILNYSMNESTAYTYPVLLASKLADNLVAVWRKHPVFSEKPLIDYRIAMIFLPSVLCGAKLGASFTNSIPNIVLQIILIFFVTMSFITTIKKVKIQWNIRKQAQLKEKENEEQCKKQQDQNHQIEVKMMNEPQNQKQNDQQNKIEDKTDQNSIQQNQQDKQEILPSQDQQQEQKQDNQTSSVINNIMSKYNMIIKNEKRTFPVDKVIIILGMFVLLLVYYILLGGKKSDSPVGIEMCSEGYWTILVKYETKIKELANHVYVNYDINMQKLGVNRFIINGFLCGFINGLVGFGGSILIVPVIVVLGLHPRAATATTSFLTIFQSGITTATALIGGQIEGDAFGFLFGISFVGSFIFTGIFNKIVDHYKLQGLTIFFTAVVQILLLLATVALWIKDLAQNPFSDQTSTQDFCGN